MTERLRAATGVYPPKPNALHEIFGRERGVVIGVIHSLALPGAPLYKGGGPAALQAVYDFALAEAERYQRGGVDGLIVENAFDLPFAKPEDIGYETVATMSVMASLVRQASGLPVGINVLANAGQAAVAVAQASASAFIRVNQWVNGYVANEGFIEGRAGAIARYRAALRADELRVFADVHVKHGAHAIVADRTLGEQTRDAEFFDADVLIATGNRTGDATAVEEIQGIQQATRLPVIIGSGVTAANARELLAVADGAIVASSLKVDGVWWNPVDPDRVQRLTETIRSLG